MKLNAPQFVPPSSSPFQNVLAWSALLTLTFAACKKKDPAPGPMEPDAAGTANPDAQSPADPETAWRETRTLAWERSAYFSDQDEWSSAREALDPVLADQRATPEDWVRAATIEMQAGNLDKVEEYLAKAEEGGEPGLAARYIRARLATFDFDTLETARDQYENLLVDAPEDLATRFALGRVYEDMDPPDDATWEANQARAQVLYQEILDTGLAHGGPWYVSALYRMFRLSLDDPDPSRRAVYEEMWKGLESIGAKAVSVAVLNEGQLAEVAPPLPAGNSAKAAGTGPTYQLRSELSLPGTNHAGLAAWDMDGDRLPDVLATSGEGLVFARQDPEGTFTPEVIVDKPVSAFLTADLSRDGYADALVVEGSDLVLYDWDPPTEESGTPTWKASGIRLGLPAPPAEIQWLDFDHDGDLDVLCVGEFGLRLVRNDGAGRVPELAETGSPQTDNSPKDGGSKEGGSPDGEPTKAKRGGFADVTEGLGVSCTQPLTWCGVEDFDADQDVDFIVGGPGVTLLASSLRNERFEDLTEETFGARKPDANRPVLGDMDGDELADFVFADDTGFRIQFGGRKTDVQQILTKERAHPVLEDLNLDGMVDLFWPSAEYLATGILAPGLPVRGPFQTAEGKGSEDPLLVAELDRAQGGVIAPEIMRLVGNKVEIWENQKPANQAMRLRYQGQKDNPEGLGAVVELRSGGIYRRTFYRGVPIVCGLGGQEYADVVRVTWPNGVTRTEIDIEGGDPFALDEGLGIQTEGLIGSCPFLYSWNGEKYEFISDVLGITPLGLPMGPGMLVPPDHDEYVLVRGDQLKPKDGFYELQFTEELREVTYLDRAQLLVVDHPEGTELHPNERFCFPPFPNPTPHLFDDPVAPILAMGSDGADWTRELSEVDDTYAAPAKPLKGQYLGLSEPHWIELQFDPAFTQGAERLRLVCTGWFYWTDASVNMATARTPGVEFVPPIIMVPETGPEGETWVPIGPPVGFPAGKTKSMVIDLAGVIDSSNPRLRIHSSLTLYWDALRLARGDRDGTQTVTPLEPASAKLWHRGFSASVQSPDPTQPERFDWNAIAHMPRWNQHPGNYTKFGECLPLLQAIDDRFIIMGSGDALTLRFDADQVPELAEGMERSFLVFLDGWAKDRDPNTVEALNVEPLPFHGMGAYPYGPEKSFPSGPAHQRWRKEWNTRPARTLITPLSPAALAQWVERKEWPTLTYARRAK